MRTRLLARSNESMESFFNAIFDVLLDAKSRQRIDGLTNICRNIIVKDIWRSNETQISSITQITVPVEIDFKFLLEKNL